MASAATIVHDPSEATPLCPALGLYLKPITKLAICVALPPPLRAPGKSVSNWEVMERLRAMAAGAAASAASLPGPLPVPGSLPGSLPVPAEAESAGRGPLSALRIAKSSLDFVRFEAEVENRALVRPLLARLDGGAIRLGGFPDALRVRAAEFRPDFPSRHDWDAFFRDARDMDEALPGERPDTIRLEGLPCRWFAPRPGDASGATSGPTSGSTSTSGPTSGSTSGSASDRPSEALLRQAFGAFGAIRHVDIPMLDPYRGEAAGRGFHTFGLGGQLHFEAFVQYREYAGFARAMAALRGTKLMLKGEDGKAVACGIKVSFDATKHLSDASIRRRQLERQKLRELELQREEQKRREREDEERRRLEERKQREAEAQERARRREQKQRRREQRQREREQRRRRRRAERGGRGAPRCPAHPEAAEAEAEAEAAEPEAAGAEARRRLLLAQRDLQSVRLVAALLGRVEASRLRQRRLQEAELRRVEQEKRRALGLQRRERELRQRLLALLLGRGGARPGAQGPGSGSGSGSAEAGSGTGSGSGSGADLLRPVLDILHSVAARAADPDPDPDPAPAEAEAEAQEAEGAGQQQRRRHRGGAGRERRRSRHRRDGRARSRSPPRSPRANK